VRRSLADFQAHTGVNELIVATAVFDPAMRMRSCELLAGALPPT
jgi:hypothetical protein